MYEEIEKIVSFEMNEMLKRMCDDFEKNYNKKVNNWILNKFDNKIKSNMVFVSSFESKYGNMFENISQEIAKLKFGEKNVKLTFKGVGVTDDEYISVTKDIEEKNKKSKNYKKSQYIITKLNNEEGVYSNFRDKYKGDGRKKTLSELNQEKLPELLEFYSCSDKIIKQPVDLIYYDKKSSHYNIFEIKAGGDLDSSNAPKNIDKMLKIYSSLGKSNANLYFATLYNKDGTRDKWKGAIKYQLAPDVILISEDFWLKILPEYVTFVDFKNIYYDIFDKLDFKNKLETLIEEYSGK